jgi:predicted NUDIX family phosphoesterase
MSYKKITDTRTAEQKTDDILELSYLIFNGFMTKWNLPLKNMANLIEKYKLVDFVSYNEEDLNEQGVGGCIIQVEKHILKNGGRISHGRIE